MPNVRRIGSSAGYQLGVRGTGHGTQGGIQVLVLSYRIVVDEADGGEAHESLCTNEDGVFGRDTLFVIDVATDPASPTLITEFNTHGRAGYVEVVGTRAYVMSPGEGLIILDVSNPATPARLGNWYCPAVLREMDKVGDTLYVVDAINGIRILDVSDPTCPALLGSYQTVDTSEPWEGNHKITVRDGIAYLAAGCGGLEVVDVRDPTHTALLDSYVSEWDLWTQGVQLDGDFLYVGTTQMWGGYFCVFDISDPESPTLVADDLHLIGGGPEEMDIDPSGLVHAVSGSGVCVINVDDPEHPFKWDCSYDPSWPTDVVVAGHLRYVTKEDWYEGDGGLYIQDISDPLNPVNVGFFYAKDACSLVFRDGVVYMISQHWEGWRGLLVIDVSDPTDPFLIGHVPLPNGDEVLVDGRHAYVVDDNYLGLAIIDLTGMVAWGDMNCDGSIDFDDIDPLVLALSGEEAYREALSDCHWLHADCNGDSEVNFDDIDAFVAMLTAP